MFQKSIPRLGTWGGTCRCPDGKEYEVGDNGDGCGSIACVNGQMVNCNKTDGPWSGRKVTCEPGKKINVCTYIGHESYNISSNK